MNLHELTETVLLQLKCFWALCELDEGYRGGDRVITAEDVRLSSPLQLSAL